MSMPLRITPRPVKKLRAAPTAKWDNMAIVNAIQTAERPVNRRNGATGMNAPTAVETPVSQPSLNGAGRHNAGRRSDDVHARSQRAGVDPHLRPAERATRNGLCGGRGRRGEIGRAPV